MATMEIKIEAYANLFEDFSLRTELLLCNAARTIEIR